MPKSLIVIGSGAVGVEFASVFKSFGAEVTIIEALPRIVPVEDEEISKELTRAYKKRGIEVNAAARSRRLRRPRPAPRSATPTPPASRRSRRPRRSSSPWAAARAPADAGLDKTKIQLDRGFIPVNEWMETAEPGVYAIGDIVAGLPQLAHVGAMCGVVVASKLAGKYARAVRKDRVPGCTYCDPQIGSVGLTEAQAKEKGYQVKVGKFPFVGNSKATILDSHDGFVKIVSDAKYGEVLGVHIIGPQRHRADRRVRRRDGARSHGRRDDVHHPRPPHAVREPAGRLQQRRGHGDQRVSGSLQIKSKRPLVI